MDHLTADQQDAVRQLQAVLDSQNYDTDVLISVLQSVDWNVQVCAHYPRLNFRPNFCRMQWSFFWMAFTQNQVLSPRQGASLRTTPSYP